MMRVRRGRTTHLSCGRTAHRTGTVECLVKTLYVLKSQVTVSGGFTSDPSVSADNCRLRASQAWCRAARALALDVWGSTVPLEPEAHHTVDHASGAQDELAPLGHGTSSPTHLVVFAHALWRSRTKVRAGIRSRTKARAISDQSPSGNPRKFGADARRT